MGNDTNAVAAIDRALAALCRDAGFCRKLEYATDTHSSENWLRTEIAYAISRSQYEAAKGSDLWVWPERAQRVDLPIKRVGQPAGEFAALAELKVLYNNRGAGAYNVRVTSKDIRTLWEQAGDADDLVMLVALVFMRYVDGSGHKPLLRLKTMDMFQDELMEGLPLADVEVDVRTFDAEVVAWPDVRPTFQVRFLRLHI